MQNFFKQNLTLVLAFLLPILLIFIVAINAYFPSLFFKTDYNFVYASCDSSGSEYPYGCENYAKSLYSVQNNKLVVNTAAENQDSDLDKRPDRTQFKVRLFLHDTKENASREITVQEAQKIPFDPLLTSPDEVTISSGYSSSGDFFLFNGNSSYGYYLTKGKLKSRLNLINDNRYYSVDNFHFIGWVLN